MGRCLPKNKDMGRICELPDDLLIKILSFLPIKVAVSTSILSKQWEFLWMWSPKLEYNDYATPGHPMSSCLRYEEFMDRNLPLHKAPLIESFMLVFFCRGIIKPEKIKQWVGIVVSRVLRELRITYFHEIDVLSLPISLYTCVSLMTLKLDGKHIVVDVPQSACLPSLKTLVLQSVTYSNEHSLGLLLSHCPVLEDLRISRQRESDNVRKLVVNFPSLRRLTLTMAEASSSDKYVIVTPSLKCFNILDARVEHSIMIKPMRKLEEADIEVHKDIEKILESFTFVRRLRLCARLNSANESAYRAGIVFNQLEHLTLIIQNHNWSKLLIWLLGNSPKLRVLKVLVYYSGPERGDHEPERWEIKESSVPKCLLTSLETFEFLGCVGNQEEKDFLSFFCKHVRILKYSSISEGVGNIIKVFGRDVGY